MAVLVNAYATARALPPLEFAHVLRARRDRADPDLVAHLDSFIGFVMRDGQRSMTQSLYHVFRHIQRVQNHASLEVEDDAFEALAAWAWSANAVLLLPDGAVRDPSGRVLVDPGTGAAEPEAQVPYPEDARERKARHDRQLAASGVPVAPGLPPVVGECEVVLRAPADVARRALALVLVAVRAESLASGEPIPAAEMRGRLPAGFDALSPVERAFVSADAPEQQDVVNHAWRYEALWTLEWALGLVDALPIPTELCDVPRSVGVLLDADVAQLIRDAQLRAPSEILDALDLHMRWQWAVREAQRLGSAPPADLEPGVVQERRVALNWLVHFEDADWDDVDTPT